MPVTEIERTELVNQLVAAIGKQPAETLMQCVLPEGRDQLATKDDLKAFATKDELAEAVKDLATKDDLKAFATKDELEAGLRILSAETKSYVDRALAKQSRVFIVAMATFMVSTWAALFVQPLVY